jgi:FkbM family methyltransferase
MKILSNGIAVVEGDAFLSKTIEEQERLGVVGEWLQQFKPWIPKGGTVIDVGACLGDHTVTYAEMVGARGRVIAFEPNPLAMECLRHNLAAYANVELEPLALADAEKTGRIQIDAIQTDNLGASQFIEQKRGAIQAVALDSLERLRLTRLDFMKIDAEGCEPSILKGAAKTIARHHPGILIEFNARKLATYGWSQAWLLDLLRRMGYEAKPVDPNHHELEYDALCLFTGRVPA